MPRSTVYESKALPGASYELRTVGRILRHQTELKLAPERHQWRLRLDRLMSVGLDLEGRERIQRPLTDAQLEAWNKNHSKPPSGDLLSKEEASEIEKINIDTGLANETVRLAIARALVVQFTIPGDEYNDCLTVEDLLTFGPEAFAEEIEAQCDQLWKLPETERKNSESPISSPVPEDGATPNTPATDASTPETT